MDEKLYKTPGAGGYQSIPGAAAVAAQMTGPRAEDIPRLEHFMQLGKLWVSQKIDFMELFTDYDVSNQYEVFLSEESKKAGARWLYAKEESECIQRMCIAPCREFTLDVGIMGGNAPKQTLEQQMGLVSSKFVYPVVRVHRPCFCCLQAFHVTDGSGSVVGGGKEECLNLCGLCPVQYKLFGPQKGNSLEGDADYTLKGPMSCVISCIGQCPCRGPFDFDVEATNGRRVGRIANVPNGCCKMCFTNADDYEIDFDPSATAAERGLLLATTFALDFRHFEQKQQKQNQSL